MPKIVANWRTFIWKSLAFWGNILLAAAMGVAGGDGEVSGREVVGPPDFRAHIVSLIASNTERLFASSSSWSRAFTRPDKVA